MITNKLSVLHTAKQLDSIVNNNFLPTEFSYELCFRTQALDASVLNFLIKSIRRVTHCLTQFGNVILTPAGGQNVEALVRQLGQHNLRSLQPRLLRYKRSPLFPFNFTNNCSNRRHIQMKSKFIVIILSILITSNALKSGEVSGNDCSSVETVCKDKGLKGYDLTKCVEEGKQHCCETPYYN